MEDRCTQNHVKHDIDKEWARFFVKQNIQHESLSKGDASFSGHQIFTIFFRLGSQA
jgi:hypothetical protein